MAKNRHAKNTERVEIDDKNRQVREASRRLQSHPGYRLNSALDELVRMLDGVFVPNWNELMALLEAASREERLAMELVQNVHAPIIRKRFESELARKLFNHLASTMGLVDHVRRIAGEIPHDLRTEFEARTKALIVQPEIGFMQDLRNYTLHRSLPFLGHTLTIGNVNTRSQTFESEIELSAHDLLQWSGWKSGSRSYLQAVTGGSLRLRAVTKRHGELVDSHNRWLAGQLAARVNLHIAEVNELIVQFEMARFGLPRDDVSAMVSERTARNAIPPPERWIGSPPEPPKDVVESEQHPTPGNA